MGLLEVVIKLDRPVRDRLPKCRSDFVHMRMLAPIKSIGKGVKRSSKLPLKIFEWEGYAFDLNRFLEIEALQDIQKKRIQPVASSDISAQVRGMRGTNYFYSVMEATGLRTAHAMDQKFSPKLYSPRGEEGNPSRSKQWSGYQKGRLPRERKRKEVEKLTGYSFEDEVDSMVWRWLDLSKPMPRNTLHFVSKLHLYDSGRTHLVLNCIKTGNECASEIHELGENLRGYPHFENFGLLVMLFRTAVEHDQRRSSKLLAEHLVSMLVLVGAQLQQRGICARMFRFVVDQLLPLGGFRSSFNLYELAKMSALRYFLSTTLLARYERNTFWRYLPQALIGFWNTNKMGSGFGEIFPVPLLRDLEEDVSAICSRRDQALENFAIFLEIGRFPLVLHHDYFSMDCECRDLTPVDSTAIAKVVRSLKSPASVSVSNPLDAEVSRYPWPLG